MDIPSTVDMVTVFNFENQAVDYSTIAELGTLISALVFLTGFGCLLVTLMTRKKSYSLRWVFSNGAFYMISTGLIGLLMSTPILIIDKMDFNNLAEIYRNKRYQIVEGVVSVVYRQPEQGHDKGDIILIEGEQFEIDYFTMTRAYNQTIAHGGVLKDGVHARVFYHEGKILRIDIGEK